MIQTRDVRTLKITYIETFPFRINAARIMKSSKGATPWVDFILVKIHADNGEIGIGEVECPPSFKRIGPEAPRGSRQLIDDTLGPLIIGLNPFDIELISKLMNDRVQGHLWTKSGIDLALWDLCGKSLGVPSYCLLGGRVSDKVPVEGLGYGIPMIEPEKVAELAKYAVEELGFSQIELKVGDTPDLDVARVRLTREAVGLTPSIKVDFSKGYDARTAINVILAMEEHSIQWVEQPLDYWDLDGMVRIRNAIHTPLIADECVNNAYEMMIISKMGAADAVHVKPTVKGGITECKKIEHVAEAAGMFVIPGVATPTGVGMAAVHTFTASCRNPARGIHGSPLDVLADDIVKDPIPQHSAWVHFSDRPGLGFELDEDKVEQYLVKD